MKIEIKNVNPTKLHDELIKASLAPLLVENDLVQGENVAVNTWLTYPDDANVQAIQTVIDAHDSTPLQQPPTAEERLIALEDAMLMLI